MGKKRKHEQLQTPLDIEPLPENPTDDITIKQSRTTPLSTYRTIKIPIKSILRNKKNMLPLIKELVIRANDLMIHTYQFIRLYILNQYTHQSTIRVINEKFIQYCMKTLGTRDKRGRKCEDPLIHELQKFYMEEYRPIMNHQKTNLIHMSHMCNYLATEMHTGYMNNIKEHFIQHFKRFINITTKEITTDKSILYQFKKQLLNNQETDEIFNTWKELYLPNIIPLNIEKNIHYDLKSNPLKYLKGMLFMNDIL